jgi:hypothetical protein
LGYEPNELPLLHPAMMSFLLYGYIEVASMSVAGNMGSESNMGLFTSVIFKILGAFAPIQQKFVTFERRFVTSRKRFLCLR